MLSRSTSTPSASSSVARTSPTKTCGRRSSTPVTRRRDGGRRRQTARPMSTTSLERIQLPIEGMTCASCAARIERRLNKLEGVEATVNFATEQATVHRELDVPDERLVTAVEAAGYGAQVARPRHAAHAHHHDEPLA